MSRLVQEPELFERDAADQPNPRKALAEWVMARVPSWRDVRETTFRDRWDSYYREWRGRWTGESKTRKTERSRLISPASQIAVDTAAAELVEAIFAREQIFDIGDDVMDEQREDAIAVRDRLIEDLRKDGIAECLAEVCTTGALYGQFIAKIVTDVEQKVWPEVIVTKDEEGNDVREVKKMTREVVKVYPVAIEPGNLVPDPAGTKIDYMQGVAHEFKMPLHKIHEKQRMGIYYDTDVSASGVPGHEEDRTEEGNLGIANSPSADVIEYHGLVPTKMLTAVNGEGDDLAEALAEETSETEMTEAVITIANGGTLLRAIANPSVMEDRAIIAEQFDVVPNRFWGRGVMEKGFNMQRAINGELRARADGLAWTNNPMVAYDLTNMPPGADMNVWPGKGWGTKGDPRQSLMPMQFGSIDTNTFQHAADLERMLQFATGAVDPSTLNSGVRDQATGASALNVSGIVKRNKRTILNMEIFLTKMIRGIVWRKMQYDPERYPADYDFVVRGTVGIMAREVEQQTLVQMLQFADKGTPEYAGILRLILESSSNPNKAKLLQILDDAMEGPSEEEQAAAQEQQQMQKQIMVEQIRNRQADTAKKLADAGLTKAKELLTQIEAELIDDKMILDSAKLKTDIADSENQQRQIEISERKQALEEAKFARGD